MKIKVLSYNIHKGFSWANTKLVLSKVKHSIRDVKADIVFLQEVVGKNHKHQNKFREWPTTSQFEFLADQIWAHYAYGKNAVYDEGHHGNAILSHFPIQEWSNTNVSTNRFESRGFLYAKVEVPKRKVLHLICLHFDLFERGRRRQAQYLCQFIKKNIDPQHALIVAGDFNDWSGRISDFLIEETGLTEVFFEQTGAYAKTFPAFFPILSLDRIFVRNIKIHDCETLDSAQDLSDHTPLFVELEL